jgi:integrase
METIKRKSGIRFREKITINGQVVLSKWYRRKTDAKEWKVNKLVERDRLGVGGHYIDGSTTVNELFEKYLSARQDRARRTIDSYESTYNVHLRPFLGHLALKNLRLHHGEEVRSELWKRGLSSSRGNNVLIQLKVLFNFAVKQQLLNSNPFKNIDSFKQDKREINYWNQYEVNQFLESNRGDFLNPLYVLILNTGLRKSEVCGLMWDCINFADKIITVKRTRDRNGLRETTKGRESRRVPMNETVQKMLMELYQDRKHPSFVFTNPKGAPVSYEHLGDRAFKQAALKAGVKQIRFHDLRTTYASHFCINNGNVFALSKILGHKSVNITQKFYAETNNDFLNGESCRVEFSPSQKLDDKRILSMNFLKSEPIQHRETNACN